MSVRHRTAATVALTLSILALQVVTASTPVITGAIQGVELCPQSICDAAIFAGDFTGQVNSKPTSGFFGAAITYDEPLPSQPFSTEITGGSWAIHTRLRTVGGKILDGGTLTNIGPPSGETEDRFTVTLTMEITKGGFGTLHFTGILDHNQFPPTIAGEITP